MNWNSLFSAAWQNEIPDAGVEMLNGDSKLKNWQIKIVKSINESYPLPELSAIRVNSSGSDPVKFRER